jgi:uncharacterized protein YbaA (DUF1428 family)
MAYVDVFVLPVLASREADYLKWAELGRTVWLEHGALSYSENRADDVPPGNLTSFPKAVMQRDDEVLYCSYATYRDRAHRDAVMQRVMEDVRLKDMMADSPADMKRMIWGGFVSVVSG